MRTLCLSPWLHKPEYFKTHAYLFFIPNQPFSHTQPVNLLSPEFFFFYLKYLQICVHVED